MLPDVPVLSYGETDKIPKQNLRSIYDFPFCKYARDQAEIFEFAYGLLPILLPPSLSPFALPLSAMRFLPWAPSLHSGKCTPLDAKGSRVRAEGVLTIEDISCFDLFPQDS